MAYRGEQSLTVPRCGARRARTSESRGQAPNAVIGECVHKMAMQIFGVIRSGWPFDVNLAMPKLDFQDGI